MWNFKIIGSALLLALVMLVPGCVYDKVDCPDIPEDPDVSYLKLRLQLEVPSQTRSNPSGGEDGDGREDGQENENNVNLLDLIFYNSSSNNAINEDEENSPVIKYRATFSKGELSKYFKKENDVRNDYYLVPLKGYVFSENDRILVFANSYGLDVTVGDPISKLRDLCPQQTWWGESVKSANDFTMATARWKLTYENGSIIDGKIYSEISGNKVAGTEEDPFYVKSTIERTAARIDFMYKDSDKDNDKIKYSVISPSLGGNEVGEVWITNILPVNLMQRPSYFFKHVTNDLTDLTVVNVCQGETPDPKGQPTNYVLEPTTFNKKSSNPPTPSGLYGVTTKADNDIAFGNSNSISSVFANGVIKECKDDIRFNNYCILAYTNENTWTGTDFNSDYLTGLAFRAIYVPSVVYKYFSGTELADSDIDNGYIAGTTIYRFSPSRIVNDDGTQGNWDTGYDVYFSNEEAANSYDVAHPELNGIITKYENGVCYYNLWLRHANYDEDRTPYPAEFIPMEYAIVRNNIYRVGVTFSGPGNPDPTLREPHNIQSRIFVRKWNVRHHTPIIM